MSGCLLGLWPLLRPDYSGSGEPENPDIAPAAGCSCVKKSASLSLKDTQKDNFQSVIFAVIVKAKLDPPLKKALLLPWYHMK